MKLLVDLRVWNQGNHERLLGLGVTTVADLQEVTDADLERAGVRARVRSRLMTGLDGLKLPHRLRSGVVDATPPCIGCCQTCPEAHLKLLQAARLHEQARTLSRRGVREWSDLFELTDADLNASGLLMLQRRRLSLLMNATWATPAPPTRAQLRGALALATDAAGLLGPPYFRLDGHCITHLGSRHGVHAPEDLHELTVELALGLGLGLGPGPNPNPNPNP